MADTFESPVPEQPGFYVVNVRDARWAHSAAFGRRVLFEREGEPFAQLGVNLAILEPGQPACRYHRETAQEDFLVLSGCCRLLVNGEQRELEAWDFVHCPPGTTHVFVGAGDGPCAILMIGARPAELFYPHHPKAAAVGAQAPEQTSQPQVAYADVERWRVVDEPGVWPLA